MDRNYLTGLMLIFLLLAIYFQYSAPETPASKKTDDPKKEVFEKQEAVLKATGEAPLEMDSATRQKNYGAFAALAQGKAQSFKVENEVMEAYFNTRGGRIEKVVLKKYRTHDQKPLVLMAPRQSGMQMEVKAQKGGWIDLYTLYYTTPAQPKVLKKGETTEIRFTATLKPGQTIEHIYKLSGESYAIDYQVKLKGLEKLVSSQAPARFYWIDQMQKLESDMYYARYYATVNYSTAQEEYNYLNWPSEAEEKISFSQEKLHWFSFKHRFFNASLIAPHRNLQNVRLICSTPGQDPQVVKVAQAYADIPALDLKNGKAQFQFFFGPNHYPTLRSLKVSNFDKNVHLGWAIFGWVSKFVIIPLFIALEGLISNYGLLIILMVLIIKTVLLPLTYKSYQSMAKMRVMNELLQPELEKFKAEKGIQGKNMMAMSAEEQRLVNQKQMELYSELGSSPFAAMSGCIPLLLQMPILLALFIFFPNAIELRQQGFLWAHDLSTFDSIFNLPFTIPGYGAHVSLFTLLMTISTIALTYFNNQSQANLQGPMKYMGYFMPVIFMFVLNSYPAGLSFYYLVQNVVTIGQQALIKQFFIDESKIRAKFEEYKEKNKGKTNTKTTWVQRLEEVQRKQLEKQEAKKKQNQTRNNNKNHR